jgi:hypothetical protein
VNLTSAVFALGAVVAWVGGIATAEFVGLSTTGSWSAFLAGGAFGLAALASLLDRVPLWALVAVAAALVVVSIAMMAAAAFST